jgi:hypothetical protein
MGKDMPKEEEEREETHTVPLPPIEGGALDAGVRSLP